MTEEFFRISTSVILIIVVLVLLAQLFFSYKIANFLVSFIEKDDKSMAELNYQKIIDDLDKIVTRKCYTAYRRVLQPYVSKALKNKPLINDKVVNDITLQITTEILEEMSDDYKQKLLLVYKEDLLEDIILEMVYNTVTEMSLTINKNSIKSMNFVKTMRHMNNITED